jgi:acetolactate synthase regulatory subunit
MDLDIGSAVRELRSEEAARVTRTYGERAFTLKEITDSTPHEARHTIQVIVDGDRLVAAIYGSNLIVILKVLAHSWKIE